jgi:glyoxylase-like metal-dependent hydrolase (beta-lactamase superfamily II)
MRINDHLYLVGGGDYGFNLSGRLDANSYVIDTGEGLWMIDAGFDGGEQVIANIRADGLDPRDIVRLFVTHYHADHTGALAVVRRALSPDVQVAVSADCRAAARPPGLLDGEREAPHRGGGEPVQQDRSA